MIHWSYAVLAGVLGCLFGAGLTACCVSRRRKAQNDELWEVVNRSLEGADNGRA